MVASSSPDPTWPRVLIATTSGIATAAVLAMVTRLDVRLIHAFRGGRTVPYRAVFFVTLAAICAIAMWRRREGHQAPLGRVALVGAAAGYLSGLAAAQFVNFVLISAAGAARALTRDVDGVFVALAVPIVTFSWLFGVTAFVGAEFARRSGSSRPAT